MEKIHILHTVSNTPSVPYFDWFVEENVGNENIVFSFICFYPTRPSMIDEMAAQGCACYWIKYDYTKRKRGMISAFFQMLYLLIKIRPNIVQSHLFDDALPTLLAAKILGIKKRLITKGDTAFHWNYAKKWVWADKLNNYNSTNIIAPSSESYNFILNNEKPKKEKLVLIHHGIPFKRLCVQIDEIKNELIEKFGLKDKIIIGNISKFIEWKGHEYIIEAAAVVVKKHPKALFLFVSIGPLQEKIEKKIKDLHLENNIIITGWIDKTYIPSLYGLMSIYVHAAMEEPFGFVIAEAMANKVAVVSTPTGAALDAIDHKKDGYIVTYKNSNEIAQGIEWLLENENRMKIIAENGYKKALNMYQFSKMYNSHIDLYRN